MPQKDAQDGEEGAVAIEFALVATVLIMLLLGIVSFGIQFGARIVAAQAASEGARASVAGLTTAERISLAQTAAENLLNSYGGFAAPSRRTITATPVGTTRIDVTVVLDVSRFGLNNFSRLIPVFPGNPTATVSVNVGGS